MLLQIAEVNCLGFEEFINKFQNVIERCPIVAAAVWDRLPFQNLDEFQQGIETFVDGLTESGMVDSDNNNNKIILVEILLYYYLLFQ